MRNKDKIENGIPGIEPTKFKTFYDTQSRVGQVKLEEPSLK